MAKKGSLKTALSSHQFRLKKKQEAEKASKVAEKSSRYTTKGKGKVVTAPPVTIPFKSTDKILLIGEGNFSFTHALVIDPPASLKFLPAANITATAYDTEHDCFLKYSDAEEIVNKLREKGVEIIFGVDAARLEKCVPLRNRKFDKVVWNFPHAGKGIKDRDRNILTNQILLLGFLRSAAKLLTEGSVPSAHIARKRKENTASDDDAEGSISETEEDSSYKKTRGTILITLRNVIPYTLWDLPKLAKSPPPPVSPKEPQNPKYTQLRSFVFHRHLWGGYEHRMTKGERANGQGTTGIGGEDRTWEFCLKD